ncbi:MAG: right-handed parallel beta-helix repeat-containing protein [candidate division Zixibacteria bacterium]|nr:right-handed parallel beta-helix repeat-containing protein [candidate division Zixibacteria bacterium]
MNLRGIIKATICLLAAILALTAGVGWAQTIQTSVKKIHVHEQMFDNEQIFSKNAGMGLMNYGTPPFNNPNYYYAAVKTAPSGVWYRQAGLSPNGQKIIAQKSFTDGSYSRTEIVLMNANGTGEIIISAGNSGEGDIYGYMNPFWSDDGTVVGFAEVHNSNPNKIVRYVVSSGTSSYIYEPVAPLDACNADFMGNSTTSIVFWDWIAADGAADLFIWDGTTRTNITNSTNYSEYEPVSNGDGTVILYWSGETTAEPVNTTHTLTYSGGVWTKDVGFTPITDSYWPYWSSRSDNYIGVTVMSSKDVYVYSNTGTFVFDLTGPGYSGGSGQWNFIGFAFEGPDGEIVATSNAGRTDPGRDIIFAAPRTKLFVASTGSDSYPGTLNAPFLTINKGVTEAISGGSVNVAVGTYVENIAIVKPVNLLGAGSSTTIINGNNVGNAVTITASDVTLSGFRVTGGWKQGSTPVWYEAGGVVVNGNGGTSSLTGITIQDNSIDGNAGNGVYVSAAGHGGTADNVVIMNNQIFNNGSGGSCAGVSLTYRNYIVRDIGVWDEWRRPKNIRVELNNIYSNSEYGVYVSAGQNVRIKSNNLYSNSKYGLQLTPSWNRTDIPCEYTTVDSNNIHDNIRNGVKLTSYNKHNTFTVNTISNNGSGGTSDYYKYGFLFQDGNDNVIQNNTITGNALGGLYLWGQGDPSYTWYSTTNNTITGNKISKHTAIGGHGIYIPTKGGYPNSGFLNSDIYDNILMCNTSNAKDDCPSNSWDNGVDQGNFWDDWASNSGYPTQYNVPGTAGSVDRYPQAPLVVWVDDDWAGTPCGDSVGGHLFGYDAFDKVQDGVDGVAPAGVVNVAAGMYEEQVVINKSNLTITGAGAGPDPATHTIVKSPVILTWFFTTSANNYPVMGINGATGVQIKNLRVDGAGRGNSNYRFVGVGFWNGDGSVIDCEITGVQDTPFSGAQHGNGIYSYNNAGGPYTINVSGTEIDDFQKNGMTLLGNNLTVNVLNCTVMGKGLTSITAQNGIQIGYGAGGSVTNCSVSDIGYIPATWVASGMIFLNGTIVNVSGTSSVSGSQVSIVYQETQGSVDGVNITSADIDAAEGISIRDYGYSRFKGSPGKISAISLSPFEEEWGVESKLLSIPTTVTINNATLTGVHHVGSYGVAAWSLGDDVNLTLTNSDIQDWEIGVVAYESGSKVNVTANNNTISSNDMGFWTNAALVQDAEQNWWGDASGPYHSATNAGAMGNEVTDYVDYSPWWGANYVGDSHAAPWTWYVNTSNNSTIQEGIDLASSGDLVRARPGTYNENININKPLALLGAGQDSVLVYPDSSDIGTPNPELGPSFRGSQMCVVQATDVTIDGVTFNGNSPSFPAPIDARNGIITNYSAGDWSNLKVQNCTVKNIYMRGIYASAKNPNNLTGVDFNHNTVSNVKSVSMQSAGIMLWGSSGKVKHNNVSDASLGIFYHWYSDGNIDSNTVTTSEVCLGANSNDAATSISYNTITNSSQGIQTVYILAPVNVTFNSITACTSGVVLYGGGSAQNNVWDNSITGLGYYSTYGFWGSTDPYGALSANLKRNTIKYNFYGMVLNEVHGNNAALLSVLIGGASSDRNFIYNNTNYELLLEYCNDNQTATYNYWGKSTDAEIEAEIYHKPDQADLGLVTYGSAFLRGDVNLDGKISIADVVYLINYLFKGGPAPQIFMVADVNRDGFLTVADAVYLINYLFKGGPAPKVLVSESLKPAMGRPLVEKPKLIKPVDLHSVEK